MPRASKKTASYGRQNLYDAVILYIIFIMVALTDEHNLLNRCSDELF